MAVKCQQTMRSVSGLPCGADSMDDLLSEEASVKLSLGNSSPPRTLSMSHQSLDGVAIDGGFLHPNQTPFATHYYELPPNSPPYLFPQGYYPSWHTIPTVHSPIVSPIPSLGGPPPDLPCSEPFPLHFPYLLPHMTHHPHHAHHYPIPLNPRDFSHATHSYPPYMRHSSNCSMESLDSSSTNHLHWSSSTHSHSSGLSEGSHRHRRSLTRRAGANHHYSRNTVLQQYSMEERYDERRPLASLRGCIVKVAKEQDGSRYIQQRLELADDSEVEIVFQEAILEMRQLCDDVYGNFILQRLLEYGTPEMKKTLGEKLMEDAVSWATRVYGCRVIQKGFDVLEQQDVANLAASLKGSIIHCIQDQNGNHVVQKAITVLSMHAKEANDREDDELFIALQESLNVILDEVVHNIEKLSRHPYGCRVVQRMVENCIDPQKSRILDSILRCHKALLDDQYGNYVIQRAIMYGRSSDKNAIFDTIIHNDNVILFSKQKQASNVVESMLKNGTAEQRKKIILSILLNSYKPMNEEKHVFVIMAEDPYANYVLKTALDVLEDGELRDKVFGILSLSLEELELIPYAKHIVSRIHTYQQHL